MNFFPKTQTLFEVFKMSLTDMMKMVAKDFNWENPEIKCEDQKATMTYEKWTVKFDGFLGLLTLSNPNWGGSEAMFVDSPGSMQGAVQKFKSIINRK